MAKPPRIRPLPPSAVELSGPFRHGFVHAGGVRFHVAHAGDSDSPLVVFVHGAFGGWFDFREVLGPVAEAGFHAAAVDLRGYGMSDKPPAGLGHGLSSAVGDLLEIVPSLGHESAHLVGLGTGGAIAWAAAAAAPEAVSSIAAVCAAHPADLRAELARHPIRLRGVLRRIATSYLPLPGLRARLLARESTIAAQLRGATHPDFHPTAEFERSLALRSDAARIGPAKEAITRNLRLAVQRAPGGPIDLPVLLVAPAGAAWDSLARRALARAPRLERVVVPGTGALPVLEDPEGFCRELVGFVRRHDDRRA